MFAYNQGISTGTSLHRPVIFLFKRHAVSRIHRGCSLWFFSLQIFPIFPDFVHSTRFISLPSPLFLYFTCFNKGKNLWLTKIHRVLYFTWHGRNFRRLVCRSKSRKHVDQPESRILLFSMIFSFSTIRLPSLLFLLLSLFFFGHFHKEKKVRYWPEYIVYYILRSTAQAFVLLFSLFPSPSMRQPRKDGPSFRLIYSFHKRCAQKIGVKEIRW